MQWQRPSALLWDVRNKHQTLKNPQPLCLVLTSPAGVGRGRRYPALGPVQDLDVPVQHRALAPGGDGQGWRRWLRWARRAGRLWLRVAHLAPVCAILWRRPAGTQFPQLTEGPLYAMSGLRTCISSCCLLWRVRSYLQLCLDGVLTPHCASDQWIRVPVRVNFSVMTFQRTKVWQTAALSAHRVLSLCRFCPWTATAPTRTCT